MFNDYRNYNNTYVDYPDTIVHKKAPTDESIRLLNEFQEKALQNIIDKGKVDTNIINDIKWWIHRDGAADRDTAHCKFNVNGKEENFRFDLPNKYNKPSEVGPLIMDHVREKVARILGAEFQRQQSKQLGYIYGKNEY